MFGLSKDLSNLKSTLLCEQEFYFSFQRDLKDHVLRGKCLETLAQDAYFKSFLDLDNMVVSQNLNLLGAFMRYGIVFLTQIKSQFAKIAANVNG